MRTKIKQAVEKKRKYTREEKAKSWRSEKMKEQIDGVEREED